MGAADATPGCGAAAATWFEATTDAGLLRLSVRTPVRHAADAAIVLADCCDPLLGALDAWCGAPLDWRWVGSSPHRRTAAEVASASWSPAGGDSLPAALVEIGWTLLRNLPAPPGEFAHALQWARVPAVLTISQQTLGANELALLEPGGAVLLPESLSSPWRALLRSAIETARPGAGVPVEFLAPDAVHGRALERRDPAPAAVDSTHEVQMRIVGVVGCDRLAGWSDGGIGPVSPAAGLWSRGVPARCLAQGELVPWGDGMALAIRTTHP